MTELVLFVLDSEIGKPAVNLEVSFQCQNEQSVYHLTHRGFTGTDGCARVEMLPVCGKDALKSHQILIQTGDYYSDRHKNITFREICIEFLWDRQQKLVLPVLISAHSYTCYRGN